MAEPTIQPSAVVTSDAPVSHAGNIASSYEMLGQSLDKLGEGVEKLSIPFAERAGYESVSTDAQGNLSVTRLPIFGEAGDAYARALKISALAQGDAEAKRKDLEISKEHANDPEGYLTAAKAYRQTVVGDVTQKFGPEVGTALDRVIDNGTTLNYRRLLNEHQTKIRENFDRDTRAAIESKTEDLMSLVRSGGGGTDEAKNLARDIHQLIEERTTNPILLASKGEADLAVKHLNENIAGAAFAHSIDTMLRNPSAPYQDFINTAANKYGLDPNLLARQLYQESGFRENAVSPAGAQGIAQFTPATAARYGVDVRNPQSSIEGQARYMSDLTRQFGGNTGLALAGYNWGERNVAQWMAAGANPAAMPLETRNYVRAITGQPIEGWIRGDRPSPLAPQPGPPGGAGGVDKALAAVEAMRTDPNVEPMQRQINYERGLAAIKDYREDVVRQTNLAELGQKSRDQDFENKVILDSAGDNKITENEIKTMPGVSAESRMRMLAWKKREDMPEPVARVSQGTAMDLFRRMNLPEGDPAKIADTRPIRDAYTAGGLTRADEEWLEKRFSEARSPEGERLTSLRSEFSRAVEPLIDKSNPLMGKIDQDGKLQAYAFQRFVDQKIAEMREAKKSPLDLFDPSKPDYLGKPEILRQFQKPFEQSVRDMTGRLTGGGAGAAVPASAPAALPQRKPGETIDDFDRRTGLR